MFRRIFCFGKNRKARKNQQKDGSLLLKDITDDAPSNDSQVVPLRSAENAALAKKNEASELFNDAVNKLVEKLESINTNLDLQVHHNQQLVTKMDSLPQLLASLPEAVELQQKAFESLSAQMREKMVQDEKAISQLSGIHEKVAASAEMDLRMSENFGCMARTLTKIDENSLSQTEWLQHLNRSYTSSEQYLRESLDKHQSRFYLLFGVSLAVSLVTIVALAVVLYMLANR